MFEPLDEAEQAAVEYLRNRAYSLKWRLLGYRNWQEILQYYWDSGQDEAVPVHAHTLRRMRNQRGPEWLAQFEVTP